ncbi:MAG TPA: hypothetical protein VL551_03300 [Actinospica sp.]|jgi:hypothetical protein|nr:hypothetical protein [Actinospica sp.]
MTYRSADLTAEFEALANTTPPPGTFDLDAARARGAIVRRRRRMAKASSGLVATGLAAVLAVSLVPNSAPSAASATTNPSAGTDPFASTISFGWLPDGARVSGGSADELTAGDSTSQFNLTALAAGSEPRCQPNGCTTKAPDVNGHTAYWITLTAHSGFTGLDWEYAPNAWAELDAKVGDNASSTVASIMHKVAENAQFGTAKPIPLPFHLPAIPAGMKAAFALWRTEREIAPDVRLAGNGVGADLEFGIQDRSTNAVSTMEYLIQPSGSTFPTSEELEVNGKQVPAGDIQHVTVEGRQAVVINTTADKAPVQELIVHDIDGADFTLTAVNPQAMAFLDSAGGIIDYYKSIEVLGADPNAWTTDVIG